MTEKIEDDDRRYVIVMNGRNPLPIKAMNRAQRRAQVVVGGPNQDNPFTLKREEVALALENFAKQGYSSTNTHVFEVTRVIGHKVQLDFGDEG